MHHHIAFGLTINASLALPELAPRGVSGTDDPPDVIIEFGQLDQSKWENAQTLSANEESISFDKTGTFLIREGREIMIDPFPGVNEGALRQVLLGTVMTILLRQRGYLVLHASGVRLHGGAVLFLGPSGVGKSTMAAAFAAQGYQIGTDDIAALCHLNSRYELLPSFPRIRLHPANAPTLGQAGKGWPLPYGRAGKLSYQIEKEFFGESLPLLRIYLLVEGVTPQVERLITPNVMQSLIDQSFIRPENMTSMTRTQHFRRCMELASRVPVRRLARSRRLADLPALVRMVEEDLEQTTGAR